LEEVREVELWRVLKKGTVYKTTKRTRRAKKIEGFVLSI
jgi:hypothetical protein